ARWPGMPHYPQVDGSVKLAAGWLIEQAGWKGHSRERVGVHREQALVLVNLGGARGGDIMTLARDIQEDIERRFGLQLEMEPQLLGNGADPEQNKGMPGGMPFSLALPVSCGAPAHRCPAWRQALPAEPPAVAERWYQGARQHRPAPPR